MYRAHIDICNALSLTPSALRSTRLYCLHLAAGAQRGGAETARCSWDTAQVCWTGSLLSRALCLWVYRSRSVVDPLDMHLAARNRNLASKGLTRKALRSLGGHGEVAGGSVILCPDGGLASPQISWRSLHGGKVTAMVPDVTSSHVTSRGRKEGGRRGQREQVSLRVFSSFHSQTLFPRSRQQTSPDVSPARNGPQALPSAPPGPEGGIYLLPHGRLGT